jgi:hypothetical protein
MAEQQAWMERLGLVEEFVSQMNKLSNYNPG